MRKEATGFRLIFGYLGMFMIFIGLITGLPLLLLIFYPSEQQCLIDFLIPLGIFVVIGMILYLTLIYKRKRLPFQRCEDRHLLFLIWIMAVIAGASPFICAHYIHGMDMTISESIFEAASGFSTTGLSAYKDFIDVPGAFSPHIFSFHRALMQFIGAVGLVLMLVVLLSGSTQSMSLIAGEGHTDRLVPKLSSNAKVIFGIIFGYMVIFALALFFAGMPIFDAVVVSMAAISGGGFAPNSDSIGHYRNMTSNGIFTTSSLAIEIIVMLESIISAVSFVLHFFILTGKFKKFFKDNEIKFGIILIIIAVIFAGLGSSYNYSKANNLPFWSDASSIWRDSAFYIIEATSTTGFSIGTIEGMQLLGKPLIYICIVLMLVGGGMGSTAGGIKQYRIVVCFKDLVSNIKYRFYPSRSINPTVTYRYGEKKQLEQSEVKEAHNYLLLFLLFFFVSSILLCFLPEIDPETAMFNVASGMSNTGLSLTDFVQYGKDHSFAYKFMLWILSFGMILGRLEILPLFDTIRNYILEFRRLSTSRRNKREGLKELD